MLNSTSNNLITRIPKDYAKKYLFLVGHAIGKKITDHVRNIGSLVAFVKYKSELIHI
jgi:hypothetical protein